MIVIRPARGWIPLLVALALSLAACAPDATPTPAAPSAAPPAPVVIVIPAEPPSFSAAVSNTGFGTLVMKLVLLGLTRMDPAGNVIPLLAADLPTLANGDVVVDEQAGTMQVTWRLRPDVVWSDGQPVTAADVLFTWDAIQNPDTGVWVKGSDVVDHLE